MYLYKPVIEILSRKYVITEKFDKKQNKNISNLFFLYILNYLCYSIAMENVMYNMIKKIQPFTEPLVCVSRGHYPARKGIQT